MRLGVPHPPFSRRTLGARGFEFLEEGRSGRWDQNSSPMDAKPWAEKRFGSADPAQMRRGPGR
jgi:hypothetical protein